MKTILLALILTLSPVMLAHAEPIDLADEMHGTMGGYAWYLVEGEKTLDLGQAIKAFEAGRFSASTATYLSFGIGSRPVWVRFDIANHKHTAIARRLTIANSWLDRIELFILHSGHVLEHYKLGDALPFAQRPIDSRFFVVEHEFTPGITTLYMRVETPDPLVLPVYMGSREAMHSREVWESYSYGIVYGVILALLLYNLMLYFGLRARRYLYYSIYLALFLIMNLSYTGHGYKWLWPQQTTWQLWGNPVLMIAYVISGLLFATRFLDTRSALPRLHRFTIAACWLGAGLLAIAVLNHGHVMALLVSFSFVLLFTGLMVLLGAQSLRAGNLSAKYFLYGSIVAALAATVTALAVWGVIPYNNWTYRAVDVGTMIEAVLLALALAERLRLGQEEKIRAEQLARIDPLTGINNRRAFIELVGPLWSTSLRKQHAMSLILLDIDNFKSINDTFGHNWGDKVLIHTATVVRQSARAGDVQARWGGEEFILFMPETALEDAIRVAERIRERIAAIRFELNGKSLSFNASLGVAQRSNDVDSLEGLVAVADEYLYRAKSQGRNRVCSPLSE